MIYVDKQSGKDFERKQYKRMLRRIKPGMVLYIKFIDRLGGNYQELMERRQIIAKTKGVKFGRPQKPLLDKNIRQKLEAEYRR